MTSAACATLPNSNIIDSLWYIARQPGQVTLCGLFYQYAYLNTSANPNPNITITNGQLFDKYVSGVWQNPYLQGQTVGFAPAGPVYNALNFNLVLQANLWLTNSAALVSQIQVDAGDGLGYRTITPGTSLPVMYADTGLKVWNFKLHLTNGSVLQSHSQITVRGTISNLTCYTAGCGPYTPPGGGGQSEVITTAVTANAATIPADVISGGNNQYFFTTGATYNGVSAQGMVTMQLAPGHSTFVQPLIVVEGFDFGYYTNPDSYGVSNTVDDYISSLPHFPQNTTLLNLILSTYDVVYITFRNGTDDIHRNALLVESVIRWVNANKTGSNKDVVLGLSMGGLCARYALWQMEKNGETRQVGLFVCHGAPQQGAEVPLGFQYLANHMNSVYVKAGVGVGFSDLVQLFSGQYPTDVGGLLKLGDTPAALQMLITHLNGSYQIDNSTHLNWQGELSSLPYPTQGGIKNLAISNGSECGQTQTLTQGGSLISLNAKVNTSLIGDIISMVAGAVGYSVYVSGQWSFLMSVIPGRNAINVNIQANAQQDGGGNLAYSGKITYTKTILWLIPVNVTLTNRSFNNPSGIFPYETFAGDFYPMPNLTHVSSGWFGKYNIQMQVAPSFGFVPTPSVLDIGSGSATLLESDYSVPYSKALPFAPGKNTPFANFITSFTPTTQGYSANNNEQHITYETRNGNWLASVLGGSAPVADCTALCQINSISGDQYDCNNVNMYSVPAYSNVTYNWTYSNNLQMVSGQGTPNFKVQPVNGPQGGTGTVSVTLGILNNPDCQTPVITKTINIGIEPLVVNATVDRTPQPSGYRYLTATATQLGHTVPSDYNWYLVVNNQPTTLIGTGLTLSHYPIAPCSTIYYECQATTVCGPSIYSSYAYNTNCGGNYAMTNQSVVIYPNPADQTMSVTNNNIPATTDASGNANGIVPQSCQLVVLDNLGNTLLSQQNQNGSPTITFSTASIVNGHYFIHVLQGSNVIEKQIIIQHN